MRNNGKRIQFDRETDLVEKNHLSNLHPLIGGKSPVDMRLVMFDHRDKKCPDFCIIAADLLKFFGKILPHGQKKGKITLSVLASD